MKRYLLLSLILAVSAAATAQPGSRLPDNRELVSRARSFYVQSDSFYPTASI